MVSSTSGTTASTLSENFKQSPSDRPMLRSRQMQESGVPPGDAPKGSKFQMLSHLATRRVSVPDSPAATGEKYCGPSNHRGQNQNRPLRATSAAVVPYSSNGQSPIARQLMTSPLESNWGMRVSAGQSSTHTPLTSVCPEKAGQLVNGAAS